MSSSRRVFLQQMGVVGASTFFSPNVLLSATRPKKDKLGIALVGLGYYSTDLLAPALQMTEKCYLAGIVTGTPAKAETWKKKYNIPDKNIYNYQNFDQIANNPDIDVVPRQISISELKKEMSTASEAKPFTSAPLTR